MHGRGAESSPATARGTRTALPRGMHIKPLSLDQLATVTGGVNAPLTPMPNMGAPKYSAAWWDIVRARGLSK